MTNEEELKQWKEIEEYENKLYGVDKFIAAIGQEEYDLAQLKKLNYFQKRADRLITIIMQKYNETKNKTYLHILDRMGVDVDYSINDYRG